MDGSEEQPVLPKTSTDVLRKKLEAELRATEEIARIKQSVIEKRLAVELATLGEETLTQPPSSPSPPLPPPPPPQYQPDQKPPAKPAMFPSFPKLGFGEQKKARTVKKLIIPPVLAKEAATASTAFAGAKHQKSPFSLRFRRSQGSRSSIMIPSFHTFSQKHEIPDMFIPIRSDPPSDAEDEEEVVEEEEEEEELGVDGHQPRKRASFFKGVMNKFKRRLRPEDKEQQ